MTKKSTDKPISDKPGEDEACRRLMISIYGSEAEAKAAAKALGREITPEEETLIERLYDSGDEIANDVMRKIEGETGSVGDNAAGHEQAEISLTDKQEEEFDAFMLAVYRRAEAQEKEYETKKTSTTAQVVPLVQKSSSRPRALDWRMERAAALSELDKATGDEADISFDDIWVDNKLCRLSEGAHGDYLIYLEGDLPADAKSIMLGEKSWPLNLRKTEGQKVRYEIIGMTLGILDDLDLVNNHSSMKTSARTER